jgi:hypothetical protein
MKTITFPTFVFEGTDGQSNVRSLDGMARATKNPNVRFLRVKGTDHFSVLAPTNAKIARKVLADQGPQCNITFTDAELNTLASR